MGRFSPVNADIDGLKIVLCQIKFSQASHEPSPMHDRAPVAFGPIDHLVGYQLRRAFLRSNSLFTKLAGETGLAPGQYGVLKLIQLNPGRSQTEIAQAAGLDRSSLTQMLDLMAKRGWVERRPGPDRRTVSLHPTEAGVAVCEATGPKVAEHEAAVRGDLTDAEAATLVALLKRVRG
jgi:DNA-binding MarR family transcriptional regulator